MRASIGEIGKRILGYDVSRALAMLGMIVVHFGLVMSADRKRPAWAAEIMHLFDGRAAATFVVLAGVGVTPLSAGGGWRASPWPPRRGVPRSSRVLPLLYGLLNLVIWPGDILRIYGVSLIVAAGLITATDRRLLTVSLGLILGFMLL